MSTGAIPSTSVVAPIADTGPMLPVQFVGTMPDQVVWHFIWDQELDFLTNVSRPIVLGMATTFLGAVLGLVPTVLPVAEAVAKGQPISVGGAICLVMLGLCLAATLTFGFFAYQGQRDALQKKAEIRSRKAHPLRAGGLSPSTFAQS